MFIAAQREAWQHEQPMNYCSRSVFLSQAVSARDCDSIVELGSSLPAIPVHVPGDTGAEATRRGRRTVLTWIREAWVYDLVEPLVREANRQGGWNFHLAQTEPLQFTRYEAGGGYGWHTDQARKPHGPEHGNVLVGTVRKLSFTLQLSAPDEYEGGDFEIASGSPVSHRRIRTLTAARDRGTLLVFPSFYYHQVSEVTRGVRCSLVGWTCGPPFV